MKVLPLIVPCYYIRIPEIVLWAFKNRLITSYFPISIYHLCGFQGGAGVPGQAGFPVSTI